MSVRSRAHAAMLPMLVALNGCALDGAMDDAHPAAPGNGVSIAGWYTQNEDGTGTLQPCGSTERLRVTESGEMSRKARELDLVEGNPVYVRVKGRSTGDALTIDGIEQFGSTVPIVGCPMTGTTISANG